MVTSDHTSTSMWSNGGEPGDQTLDNDDVIPVRRLPARSGSDLSYEYSDDSVSLSDNYFMPQQGEEDLERPLRYRERDSLTYSNDSRGPVPLYGAINHLSQSKSIPSSSPPPLWLPSRIDEDEEATAVFLDDHQQAQLTPKERKKYRKYQRYLQRRKREHVARELRIKHVRGRVQSLDEWRDGFWAVLFVLQLAVVFLYAVRFGADVLLFHHHSSWSVPATTRTAGRFHWQHAALEGASYNDSQALATDDAVHGDTYTDDLIIQTVDTNAVVEIHAFTVDYRNVISIVGITGLYCCILTYLSFGFMLILSRSLIQIILICSIVVSLGWGLVGLAADPYGIISFMGFCALLVTLGYAMWTWNRVPFSATNLYTALCGIRCTADITIVGLVSIVVGFGWCVVWSMCFCGLVNTFNTRACHQDDACHAHVSTKHAPIYILLLISFHWTNTVIKNVVRVTVASAVGTWWFHPGDVVPCCGLGRPLANILTRSFGSVCLAGLVLHPAQGVKILVRLVSCRDFDKVCFEHPLQRYPSEVGLVQDEANSVDSPVEVVGLCDHLTRRWGVFRRFVRACNRWSFSYMGLYHYSFVDAGEKAAALFEAREWLDVVKDNLVHNVLLMASMAIGGSAGIFAVVVEETDGYDLTSFHKPIISAFLIGYVVGFVLSNILLLGLVGSAVNTVLVCFAAGPFEFDQNHPRLSREMRESWSQHVWEEQ